MPSFMLDTGDGVLRRTAMVYVGCIINYAGQYGGKNFVGYIILCVNVKGTSVFTCISHYFSVSVTK